MKMFSIYMLLGVVMLFNGCSSKENYTLKYGLAYNAERAKRGIPVVPSNWTIQDMGNYFDCFDPNPTVAKAHRLFKRVVINNKGLISVETDDYYSGKSFVWGPDHERLDQKISISYYYEREASGNPWEIKANLGPDELGVSITIQEADRVLTSWGLSRK